MANYLANFASPLSQERQNHPVNGSTRKMGEALRLRYKLLGAPSSLDTSVPDATEDHDVKATLLAQEVTTSMLEVRRVCDELEGLVADALWPLPKYREMLFPV